MELTKLQAGRLITVGRKIWKLLTPDERDVYYCSNGTIEFVENVAALLQLDLCTISIKDFNLIHNSIIYYYKGI